MNDLWAVPAALRCGLLSLIGSILAKKVIFSGHGIGPLKKRWLRKWLGFSLKNAAIFGVREGIYSPALLRGLGISDDKIFVTGDDAFEIRISEDREALKKQLKIEDDRIVIGVNIRLKSYNKDAEKYYDVAIEALKRASTKLNAQIVFICSDFTDSSANDVNTGRKLKKIIGEDIDYSMIEQPLEPEQIKAIVSLCSIVLAQSYHVLVFALSSFVPAIGIYNCEYYKNKTKGLFDFSKSLNGAVDLTRIRVDELSEKIVDFCQNQAHRSKLTKDIQEWEKLRENWRKKLSVLLGCKNEA